MRLDGPLGSDTGARDGSRREGRASRKRRSGRPLPLGTRVAFASVGTILLVLGIAGLFLPFLQGILFLVLAAAVFSLASDKAHAWLHGLISERWPGIWRRVERFRTRVRWKFRR